MSLFDVAAIDERLVAPRYNIAPNQPVLVVIEDQGRRKVLPMRWGLLPAWVRDTKNFPLLFNARSDGVGEKASFRNAFRRRRCLIPASGFYEWQARGNQPKQPWLVRPRSGGIMAFAGLWETWTGEDGSEIDTVAIITTDANETIAAIHHRMPVVIEPADFQLWLGGEAVPAGQIRALLGPPAADAVSATEVTQRVNQALNDGPDLWLSPDSPAAPERQLEKPTGNENARSGDQIELF